MLKKLYQTSFIAILGMGLFSSYVQADTGVITMDGTVDGTNISVSIPAVVNFSYNPNTEAKVVNDITVVNNTNAPLIMSLNDIKVADDSSWKPANIVDPTYFTDWRDISKNESENFIALGLSVLDDTDYEAKFESELWGGSSQSLNKELGILKENANVVLRPEFRVGNSFSEQKTLKATYTFSFGLDDSRYIGNSTYIWNVWDLQGQEYNKLTDLANRGVDKIYLQIDSDIDNNFYKTFVKYANQMNMKVYALDGYKNWVINDNVGVQGTYNYFKWWYETYQTSVNDDEKFSGILIDFEPYLRADWDTDRETVLLDYMRVIDDVRGFIDYMGGMGNDEKLYVTVPFWYEQINYNNGDFGSGWLLDFLFSKVDKLNVMAFRDDITLVQNIVTEEVDKANTYGKQIDITLETHDVGDNLSFYEEGLSALEDVMNNLKINYRKNNVIDTICIHSYDSGAWADMN